MLSAQPVSQSRFPFAYAPAVHPPQLTPCHGRYSSPVLSPLICTVASCTSGPVLDPSRICTAIQVPSEEPSLTACTSTYRFLVPPPGLLPPQAAPNAATAPSPTTSALRMCRPMFRILTRSANRVPEIAQVAWALGRVRAKRTAAPATRASGRVGQVIGHGDRPRLISPYTATEKSRSAAFSDVFLSVLAERWPMISAHGTWYVPAANCFSRMPGMTTLRAGTRPR